MLKKFIYHANGILFGYPKRCTIMEGLTFNKIRVVYPSNQFRSFTLYHEWKVAAKTVQPDERFLTHSAWMLHIICEHGAALANIATYESNEITARFYAYKEKAILDHRTIKTKS